MELSADQYKMIQSFTRNYFSDICEMHEIKISKSEEFLDIIAYPKSSLILNSLDIAAFFEKLQESFFELKYSSEFIIIEFDVIQKSISFSVSF